MTVYILLILLLAVGASIGWSVFAARQRRLRRERRSRQNLEDQRIWDASLAARRTSELPPT